MVAAAARVLRIPVSVTLTATWPGAAAAVGVALGAGVVRLWSGLPAIPEMAVAGLLGALGGLGALALLAPAMFRELRTGLAAARGRHRAGAPGA